MLNAVFLCIFLAHGTTAAVARQAGAGDLRRAYALGDRRDLAGRLDRSSALAAVGIPLAPILVDLLGASGTAAPYAVTYLRISLLGLPAMLVVLAATGALRGLKDTRTPLLATGLAAIANVPLNLVLVYPLGLGIAGSAIGTVIAQAGAATWLCVVVVRGAGRHSALAATGPSRHQGGGQRERASAGAHRAAAHLAADDDLRRCRSGGRRPWQATRSPSRCGTCWRCRRRRSRSPARRWSATRSAPAKPAAAKAASRRALAWGLGSGLGDGSTAARPAGRSYVPDLHHGSSGPRPRLVPGCRGRGQPADRCPALRPRRDPHRRRGHALSRLDDAGPRS